LIQWRTILPLGREKRKHFPAKEDSLGSERRISIIRRKTKSQFQDSVNIFVDRRKGTE
jgi:hypothetical protein